MAARRYDGLDYEATGTLPPSHLQGTSLCSSSCSTADEYIQNFYWSLRHKQDFSQYPGVLYSLLSGNKMPFKNIQANITELLAGGVDTVSAVGPGMGLLGAHMLPSPPAALSEALLLIRGVGHICMICFSLLVPGPKW